MRFIYIIIIVLFISPVTKADEGMWLPFLLNDKQIEQMQQKGLEVPFESIYSHSAPSLKDAVVSLDNGSCTGEFVSSSGLLLTNHHCGYNEIQQHSSVNSNYLHEGFWAKKISEELPNPGKTATILIEAHDVTARILESLNGLKGEARQNTIDSLSSIIEKEAIADNQYEAEVKSFFYGNTYLLFLTQTFKDVRLVGTPPSAIGKFGGDTDNWMWPRHTGDFCFFRVYSAPDGSPAEYSKDNIPFVPRKHFKINLNGISKNDYSMTLGYPGFTQRYLSSFGVEEIKDVINPVVAEVRGIKQGVWDNAMKESEAINIKYAAKYSESSNYWKYAIGQNKALDKIDVIAKRKQQEKNFQEWMEQDSTLSNKYGKTLAVLEASYLLGRKLTLAETIAQETMLEGPDLVKFALEISSLSMELNSLKKGSEEYKHFYTESVMAIGDMYKDYDPEVDQQVFNKMLVYYLENTTESLRPKTENLLGKKYQEDTAAFVEMLYSKSALGSYDKVLELISEGEKALFEDPAIAFSYQVLGHLYQMMDILKKLNQQYEEAQRLLLKGYMQKDDGFYYPDANSTLRLSFGKVSDYEPKDGVRYKYLTTLNGIMEKEDKEQDDFEVPSKLKELFRKKDYGQYKLKNGKLPVCFLTDNDITGGNSGSPVINGKGELIGVAFDGNWEAMTSDLAYEEKLQKCICVDIRYVMFIVDKLAGAQNLMDEFDIVN